MRKRYYDFINFIKGNKLGKIEEDVDLKKYCTLKIGGKCYALYEPNSVDNLLKAFKFILSNNIDYFLLGNGSNLLISDDYHFKVFICLKELNNYELKDNLLIVQAGVMGNVLSKKISYQGYHGLEFLAGIPGTIGGMIYMNAAAWNSSISDVLYNVTYIDEFGKLCIMKDINNKGFEYRKSPFMKRQTIIVSCEIMLVKDITSISLYHKYLETKMNIHPLKEKSAGCAFKNPRNMSAWQLIKDIEINHKSSDASISDLHANFLINKNHATFSDMMELIKAIQNEVFNKHHIYLETEWIIVE